MLILIFFSTGELLVIVEYCRFGNLHNYLLRHRDNFINQIDPATGKFDPTIGLDILTRSLSISSNNRFAFTLYFYRIFLHINTLLLHNYFVTLRDSIIHRKYPGKRKMYTIKIHVEQSTFFTL